MWEQRMREKDAEGPCGAGRSSVLRPLLPSDSQVLGILPGALQKHFVGSLPSLHPWECWIPRVWMRAEGHASSSSSQEALNQHPQVQSHRDAVL